MKRILIGLWVPALVFFSACDGSDPFRPDDNQGGEPEITQADTVTPDITIGESFALEDEDDDIANTKFKRWVRPRSRRSPS